MFTAQEINTMLSAKPIVLDLSQEGAMSQILPQEPLAVRIQYHFRNIAS